MIDHSMIYLLCYKLFLDFINTIIFLVLRVKHQALHTLGTYSTTELPRVYFPLFLDLNAKDNEGFAFKESAAQQEGSYSRSGEELWSLSA
jgi:hypothetical protein